MNSIVFVHKGHPYYLDIAIEQARMYNPSIPIILLGDESNKDILGIEHYMISEYFESARKFDEIFFNSSPNNREYELFCFQRWFIINEFQHMHQEYSDAFLYCDSDTLLFSNVLTDIKGLGNIKMATETFESPGFAFFNKDVLTEFCDMILWMYDSFDGLKLIKKIINEVDRTNASQGISDMTAIKVFSTIKHSGECIDASLPSLCWQHSESEREFFSYDHNINISKGYHMSFWNIKTVKWQKGIPYFLYDKGNLYVRSKGIHYQGRAKFLMIKYGINGKYMKCYLRIFIVNGIIFLLKKPLRTIRNFILRTI